MADEGLLYQYVHGNLRTVRERLQAMKPLEAATAAATLHKELQENDDVLEFSEGTAPLFLKRLEAWSRE